MKPIPIKLSPFIFVPLLFSSLAILPTTSQATTDWTPKLSPMLRGCSYADLNYDTEPVYKKAVIKERVKTDKSAGEEAPTYTTMLLRDSIAFGLPITQFKMDSNDGAYTQAVYFKTADFIKLRPLFKLPDMLGEDKKQLKNTSLGYNTQMTELKFNLKDKSISCSGYAS